MSEARDFFVDYANIFNKTEQVDKDPDVYDSVVFQINRYISFDFNRSVLIADLSKYLSCLSGRYYYLLDRFFAKGTGQRVKWIKSSKEDEDTQKMLGNIAQEYNCSISQAVVYKKIFERYGVDLQRRYGGIVGGVAKTKRADSKTAKSI